ncbi:MAG: nuclease-related domain-containing protein [Solirubrobacteraceae bacterium]
MSYARRQQYRRLSHAGEASLGSVLTALFAFVAASVRALPLAGTLLLASVGLGLCARRSLSLARRSRVGARSEDEVRRTLSALQAEGWRLRHSLEWRGRGDIDAVAIAPSGVGVVIEVKTRSYDRGHLARVRDQALWLARRRRRWCRAGALGVLCVVRARGVRRVEHDVLVVSIDQLAQALRSAAGGFPDPMG